MQQASLLFLMKPGSILLAMKKRGFGVGHWNGVGGKPEGDETISQTAIRECKEEIYVTPKAIKERGRLNFYFPETKKHWEQQVVVFTCEEWEGEPTESEEMAPKWFDIDKIPYDKMWVDDVLWLPKVIKGEYVKGNFYFGENEKLLKYEI
jgi:8-oxo-dGTP pyrophosphatase MutT (NUDIX family)